MEDSKSKRPYEKPQVKRITLERMEGVLAFCKYDGGGSSPADTPCDANNCLVLNTTSGTIACGS